MHYRWASALELRGRRVGKVEAWKGIGTSTPSRTALPTLGSRAERRTLRLLSDLSLGSVASPSGKSATAQRTGAPPEMNARSRGARSGQRSSVWKSSTKTLSQGHLRLPVAPISVLPCLVHSAYTSVIVMQSALFHAPLSDILRVLKSLALIGLDHKQSWLFRLSSISLIVDEDSLEVMRGSLEV